ncbi:MAG: hypothetical protein QM536_04090, partial [Chitinophagaceae bacterium]|nr:hypothetical protein [Chitinophagaceae bacterium]
MSIKQVLLAVLFLGVSITLNAQIRLDSLMPSSVKVGDTVTMYGNFSISDIAVVVKDRTLSFRNIGSTKIKARIPLDFEIQNSFYNEGVERIKVYKTNTSDTSKFFVLHIRKYDPQVLAGWGDGLSNLPIPESAQDSIVQISSGKRYNIALHASGNVYAWTNAYKLSIDMDSATDTGNTFRDKTDNITSNPLPRFTIRCPSETMITGSIGTSTFSQPCVNNLITITNSSSLPIGNYKIKAQYTNNNIITDSISLFFRIVSSGTEANYVDQDGDGLIEIYSIEQLNDIRKSLYQSLPYSPGPISSINNSTLGCPSGVCVGYELMNDLDFKDSLSYTSKKIDTTYLRTCRGTNCGWLPIGNGSNYFNAIFEGNHHIIKNIVIRRDNGGYVGLFGDIHQSIGNLGLDNAYINVNSGSHIGGLAGNVLNVTNITQCYVIADSIIVNGNNNSAAINIGGLIGRSSFISNDPGSISQCYTKAPIIYNNSGTGQAYIGGIIGEIQHNLLSQCFATKNIITNSVNQTNVGGLVGLYQSNSDLTIVRSYYKGDISVTTTGNNASNSEIKAGGLIGGLINGGTISQCYTTGNIYTSTRANGTRNPPYSYPGMFYGLARHPLRIERSFWNSNATTRIGNITYSNSSGASPSGSVSHGINLSDIKRPCSNYTAGGVCILGPGFEYAQDSFPKIQLNAQVSINGINFIANNNIANTLSYTGSVTNVINSPDASNYSRLTFANVDFIATNIGITTIPSSGTYTVTNLQNGLGITLEDLGSLSPPNDTTEVAEKLKIIQNNTTSTVNTTSIRNIVSVSSGGNYALALTSKGTVLAIGDTSGWANKLYPADTNIIDISASETHSLGLRIDGKVITWGDTTFQRGIIPSAATSSVSAVSAGKTHSIALKNGNIIAWGDTTGQKINSSSSLVSISAGNGYTIGLRNTSILHTWNIDATNQNNIKAISAGYKHYLTLNENGKVEGYGESLAGQTSIPSVIFDNIATYVAAGETRSYALYKKKQTISFPPISTKKVGDVNFSLNATATSELLPYFKSSDTSKAIILGMDSVTIKLKKAGTVQIIAYQNGNHIYLKADSVTSILKIKTSQTITFDTLEAQVYKKTP